MRETAQTRNQKNVGPDPGKPPTSCTTARGFTKLLWSYLLCKILRIRPALHILKDLGKEISVVPAKVP